MEFITIGSSVLALPGHSSAQTELCSWMTNFFHCSVQFSSVTQLCSTLCNPMDCTSTVVLKIVYILASKQSLDLLCLTNACCLFPAFMDGSRHQPALLSGTWCLPGKPLHSFLHSGCWKAFRACLSVAQGALFLSRKKMGKLEASPLNLGPNSIS